jgi:hypothetical protein
MQIDVYKTEGEALYFSVEAIRFSAFPLFRFSTLWMYDFVEALSPLLKQSATPLRNASTKSYTTLQLHPLLRFSVQRMDGKANGWRAPLCVRPGGWMSIERY